MKSQINLYEKSNSLAMISNIWTINTNLAKMGLPVFVTHYKFILYTFTIKYENTT